MKLRRFLMASALTLSFIVSTPSAAQADPISAAVVAFVGFTGTAAAVATFAINSALYAAGSFALGKVSGALSGKNKQGVQQRQASVTSLSIGEVPREMVAGVCVTGGSMIDAFNHGGQYGTDYVSMCIALADHAVEALYGVIVDEVEHLFPGSGVQPGYSGLLQVYFANATEAGAAPPAHILAADAGWTETDRLAGISHVWVTYKFDEKVWTQGHPKLKFQMRGIRVYDPRRDPALGYVGPNPNTWEDRYTHAYDANAALVRYAFTRGIYAEGHQGDPNYLLIGRGLSAEEAPPERVIAAANLCAEPVTDPDGQPNIRYKVGGVVRASDDFIQVEEMFAAAMAGVIVQREGGVEVEPGHAKAAVATITDGDLIVGETVSFQAFLPDADGGRINTVVPRYVSPAQNWSDHAGPVRRDLADIAEDGGPRETTLPLVLVYEAGQADRCAEIARRMARLERRATLVLGPEYSWLEEGDWIAWRSDRHHGGSTVRYRIESWSLDEQWRMRLSLREIASSVYGVPDPVEDTAEVPPAPVPIDALTLPGASAQAITLAGDASVIPAIRFTWDTPVDGAIRAIRGEVRILGDTDASPTRFEDVAAGVAIATNGVAAGQVLQARLVPIGDPTRPVLPSVWFTVTTGEIVAGDVVVGGRRISEMFPPGTDLGTLTDGVRTQSRTLIREALERWNRTRDEAEASIEREETIRDDLVQTRETLTLANADALALIETERTLSIERDRVQTEVREIQFNVLGDAIAATETTVGTVVTNLEAETYRRELDVSTLGESVATVSRSVGTVATALEAETETRETQISEHGDSLAAHDRRITTAADDAGAAVRDVETLAIRVGTAEGSIETIKEVQTDIEGRLSIGYAIRLNNQGRMSGLYLLNDGTTTTADFEADFFRVWSGSASVPMLAVTAEGVFIAGSRVNTASIVPGAVTNGASSRAADIIGVVELQEVQSCVLSSTGGRIRVDFSNVLFGSSLTPQDVRCVITRNFTPVFDATIGRLNGMQRVYVASGLGPDDYVDIPGGLNAVGSGFFVDTDAPAGVNAYRMYIGCPSGVTVSERNLALLELKR